MGCSDSVIPSWPKCITIWFILGNQIQPSISRDSARLSRSEVVDLTLDEANFASLIAKIKCLQQELLALDGELLDQSEVESFDVPVGKRDYLGVSCSSDLLNINITF